MKILASVMIVLSLLATPVESRQETILDKVRLAGCRSEVVLGENHSIFESYFNSDENKLYIGTRTGKLPKEYADAIIFHEAGHCVQLQDGTMKKFQEIIKRAKASAEANYGYPDDAVLAEFYAEILVIELDADARAAEMLCRRGLDGRAIYYELLVYAKENLGYEGDARHGSLQNRIDAAASAPMCKLQTKAL